MKILATFVGGWGHAEPLLPLAELSTRRGAAVLFAGQTRVTPRVRDLGFRTVDVGPDTLSTERLPPVPVDRERERRVASEHFVAEFGAARSTALAEILTAEDADLVVCDEMDAGAVIAAERAGLECITVSVLAAGRLTQPSVIGTAWDRLRESRGLEPDPACRRFGGTLRLRPAPPSLADPTVPTPFASVAVRPAVLDRIGPLDPSPQLVYATLGTVFDVESGDLFARLVAALSAVAPPSLLTIGHRIDRRDLPPAPTRVRIEAFVPQRDVLPHAAAVVCHGGTGTLVAALACGVPVVVLPMGADQPDNADRCAELGVGIVLDAMTATAADIAAAVSSVVRDSRIRRAARAVAVEAAALPPVSEVDVVARLLDRRRR